MKKNTRNVLIAAGVASALAVGYVFWKRQRAAQMAQQQRPPAFQPPPTTPAVYTPPSSPAPADVWPGHTPLDVSIGDMGATHFEAPGDLVVKGQPFSPIGDVGYDGYGGFEGGGF